MNNRRSLAGWIGLIASLIGIFSFLTGIEAIPQLISGVESGPPPEISRVVSAVFGPMLDFIAFSLTAFLLFGLSYALARSLNRTFFVSQGRYGVLDGLAAGAVLVVFMALHYSIFEAWWGFSPLFFLSFPSQGAEVSLYSLYDEMGGLGYFLLSLVLTSIVIEQSDLWPIFRFFASFSSDAR